MANFNSQAGNQRSEVIPNNQQTSSNAYGFKNADDLLASVKDKGLVNLNEGVDFSSIFTSGSKMSIKL